MNIHSLISYLKSVIRIAGFLNLLKYPFTAIILLIFAEILGIVEELVVE